MRNGSEWTEEIRNEAEKILGYRFKNAELLKICFTHKSYSNAYGGKNNERLEFLGDAVLELCVSEQLFKRMDCDEGKLTELRQRYVNKDALETAAKRAGLMRFMRFSGGEENIRGKTVQSLRSSNRRVISRRRYGAGNGVSGKISHRGRHRKL